MDFSKAQIKERNFRTASSKKDGRSFGDSSCLHYITSVKEYILLWFHGVLMLFYTNYIRIDIPKSQFHQATLISFIYSLKNEFPLENLSKQKLLRKRETIFFLSPLKKRKQSDRSKRQAIMITCINPLKRITWKITFNRGGSTSCKVKRR